MKSLRHFLPILFLPLAGCGESSERAPEPADGEVLAGEPVAGDPPAEDPVAGVQGSELAELTALWSRASADRTSLDDEEKTLLEALFQALLEEPSGELAGAQWQVQEVVGSGAAELHLELLREGLPLVTIDAKFRVDLDEAGRAAYGTGEWDGYRANLRNHFFFILVGRIDLRAVGKDDDFKTSEQIAVAMRSLPLATIAEL